MQICMNKPDVDARASNIDWKCEYHIAIGNFFADLSKSPKDDWVTGRMRKRPKKQARQGAADWLTLTAVTY